MSKSYVLIPSQTPMYGLHVKETKMYKSRVGPRFSRLVIKGSDSESIS